MRRVSDAGKVGPGFLLVFTLSERLHYPSSEMQFISDVSLLLLTPQEWFSHHYQGIHDSKAFHLFTDKQI